MPNGERRWMLLTTDGGYSWLGRNSDPTPDELDARGGRLAAQGVVGWLVVHEGDYWGPGESTLSLVRPLAEDGDYEQAVAAWKTRRQDAGG